MSERSAPRRKAPRLDDPREFAAHVGEGVRRARQARGWTQAQLADEARFSSNYIARLERGEVGPSLYVAYQICETLGMDLDTLMRGDTGTTQRTGRRVVG
jgi:transcriptional regulator with XRE-family HTH domain